MNGISIVAIDLDALLESPILSSILKEREKLDFFNFIITQSDYKLLCSGLDVILHGKPCQCLEEYLEEQVFHYSRIMARSTITHDYHGHQNKMGYIDALKEAEAIMSISSRILKRIREFSEDSLVLHCHWKNFLQDILSNSISKKVDTQFAIVVECPTDFLEQTRSFMRRESLDFLPTLLTCKLGSVFLSACFWQHAARILLNAKTFKTDCSLNDTKSKVSCDRILIVTYSTLRPDEEYTTRESCIELLMRSMQNSREAERYIDEALEVSAICKGNFSPEKMVNLNKYDSENLSQVLHDVADRIAFAPALKVIVFCQIWRLMLEFLQASRSHINTRAEERDSCVADSVKLMVSYLSVSCPKCIMNSRKYSAMDFREILATNDGHRNTIPLNGFHYLLFLNGYSSSKQGLSCIKADRFDDVKIWNRFHARKEVVKRTFRSRAAAGPQILSICTDGAINTSSLTKPDIVIGDFDSLGETFACVNKHDNKVKFKHMPDQNSTDFEKSLRFIEDTIHPSMVSDRLRVAMQHRAISRRVCTKAETHCNCLSLPMCSTLVLGAGGGRKDHEFSIYHTLLQRAHLYEFLVAKMENNIIIPIVPGRMYHINGIIQNTKCGILPLCGKTASVITEGLKWNLHGFRLDFTSSLPVGKNQEELPSYSSDSLVIANSKSHYHFARIDELYNDLRKLYEVLKNKDPIETQQIIPVEESPTISTSNCIIGFDECDCSLESLLRAVEIDHALGSTQKIRKVRKTESKLSFVSMKISSLYVPVLLTLECNTSTASM